MAITAFRQEGPSSVFLNLIRAFDRNEITPVLGVTDADERMLAKVPADVEVIRIGRPGARYPIRSLASAVRRSEADALLTTLRMNLTALTARPLLRRHVPILVRQANHASSQVADLGPLKKVAFAHDRLGKRADVVIAQSRVFDMLSFQGEPIRYPRPCGRFISSSRMKAYPTAPSKPWPAASPSWRHRGAGAGEELVTPGETGWLASPGSVTSLTTALHEAIRGPQTIPAAAIKNYVVTRFGTASSAQAHTEAIHEAVTTRRAKVPVRAGRGG